MSEPGISRVILLTLGWEELDRSVSIHGDTSGTRLREPVPAVLLQSVEGWVLLDTGLNPALVRDPPLHQRFHGASHGIEALLPEEEGDPLLNALCSAGVALDDVAVLALSHLHNDHAGGLRHFAGRLPVHLQRRELEYGLGPHPLPERHGMFRIDYDDPAIEWRLAEGEVKLAPGVTAVPTPGHTPGHQSFVVSLEDELAEGLIFAFDAADLQENIDDELAVGGFIDCTPEATVAEIQKLKALSAALGFRLVPGHDPVVWPALTRELALRFPGEHVGVR